MSETEQAIEWFENRKAGIAMPGARMMHNLALTALRARLERENGCEYCNGTEAEYQHTHNTTISLNTFGKARTLLTECKVCPPYANYAMKDIPARSAFIINFCPECGKKLEVTYE